MTVALRPMREPDLDTVVPLEQELFAGDPPWSAEQFRSELAGVPETRWYVVAEDGGEVVGYAGLLLPGLAGEPADVMTIAVAPGRQRGGVGTLLMTALEAEARRRGAGELLLEVRADNEPARTFYTRHGFERIAVRRKYYGGGRDGLVLRKWLRAGSAAEG
ncbi:ribosomal protein S18-alanine N-acetyltransferase [Jiangella alba]|uniref:Ribosomal-protein-alanine N-acetyltransferase n=1 Tax=Jiangella alba TaxID=561176 RepID=A0A1H5P4C0_9ACTN|nr:ribosomal protein S18-alanine N-acetyltransferase [Jiangella alba]SEF08530.1 ribosomal-protein-alanine N-acetyltransferase [Jiangella alba]